MTGIRVLLCITAGYLFGNFHTSILISRTFFHDDVRQHGSGNAGSTNMVRVYGWLPGLCTFLGDFIKAVVAAQLGSLLGGTDGACICGAAEVLGHCFPVFFKFKGGKGVASSLGLAYIVHPAGALIVTALAGALFYFTKRISICSLIGIFAFFLTAVLFGMPASVKLLAAFLVILVWWQHRENIKRIPKGEEKPLI